MGDDPRSDVINRQYERWTYPEPIIDIPGWLANNWQWYDPSHAHRLFWPDRAYRPNLDILIAGCGTNQAAVFAYTNPDAKVVAIDVSQPSLDHHAHLKGAYALHNLELHRLPIEEVGCLGSSFDLIVSTGVLHHMANPDAGLQALAACLRPEGVVALMLYARYGRIGVEMMQALFRDLGLQQDEASLRIVKETIQFLAQDHPLRSYLALAPDLQYDAGLVDTFLHGRDRSYTVDDCLRLLASAGLVFQEWFFKAPYYPPVAPASDWQKAVAAVPEPRQWAVMQRVNSSNACHFFTACRADRPSAAYRIDFASTGAMEFVPSLRYRCGLEGSEIYRPGWRMALNASQLELARRVDGHRTIGEITRTALRCDEMPRTMAADLEKWSLQTFRQWWQADFLAMGLVAQG